jgi:hypothetical protein
VTSTIAKTEIRARRIAAVDALRGVAIAAMVVYHFSWDLSYFGFVSVNVAADPGWKAFARTIAGTFVTLVGVSLVLATRQGFHLRPYLRRLAVIVGAALLVTIGTWYDSGLWRLYRHIRQFHRGEQRCHLGVLDHERFERRVRSSDHRSPWEKHGKFRRRRAWGSN